MSAAAALFRLPCEFICGAANIDALLPYTLPEIAFIGRSNVGKSSLVNALVGRNSLARTSQNPGHTKQLNFFQLGDKMILVDMPGYGYAKVSKTQKGEWDTLIRKYMAGRPTLKRACILIDARRGIMESDEEFMGILDDSALSYQLVLTKVDSVKPKDLTALLQTMEKSIKSHAAAHPEILATSSETKVGIEQLQEALAFFAKK